MVVNHRVVESQTKTRRGRRLISMPAETAAALREYRTSQLAERLVWGPAYEGSGLVFTRENGSPIHPTQLSKQFAKLVDRSELPHIRLHDLRHGYASLALAAGVQPKVVQEQLGHASIGMTLDVYSSVLPGLDQEAAATIGAAVFGSSALRS